VNAGGSRARQSGGCDAGGEGRGQEQERRPLEPRHVLISLPPSPCSDWSAVAITQGPSQSAGRRRGRGTRPGSAGDPRPPGDPGDDAETSPMRRSASLPSTFSARPPTRLSFENVSPVSSWKLPRGTSRALSVISGRSGWISSGRA
jgi:hypothetical protein